MNNSDEQQQNNNFHSFQIISQDTLSSTNVSNSEYSSNMSANRKNSKQEQYKYAEEEEYIHGMDETCTISIPFTSTSLTLTYCQVSKTILGIFPENQVVKIWDSTSHKLKKGFKSLGYQIHAIGIDFQGKHLALGCNDNIIRIQNIENETILFQQQEYDRKIVQISFSPLGNFIISQDNNNIVKIHHLNKSTNTIDLLYEMSVVGDIQQQVSISPNEKYVLISNRMYELTQKKLIFESNNDQEILSQMFSPDGQYFVQSFKDQTIDIRLTQNKQLLSTLKGHSLNVFALAFNQNSSKLATGGRDRLLKVWDIQEGGELLKTAKGHYSWIEKVAYSNNDQFIMTASLDGTIKIWSADTDKQLASYQLLQNENIISYKSIYFTNEDNSILFYTNINEENNQKQEIKVWNWMEEYETYLREQKSQHGITRQDEQKINFQRQISKYDIILVFISASALVILSVVGFLCYRQRIQEQEDIEKERLRQTQETNNTLEKRQYLNRSPSPKRFGRFRNSILQVALENIESTNRPNINGVKLTPPKQKQQQQSTQQDQSFSLDIENIKNRKKSEVIDQSFSYAQEQDSNCQIFINNSFNQEISVHDLSFNNADSTINFNQSTFLSDIMSPKSNSFRCQDSPDNPRAKIIDNNSSSTSSS